MIRAAIGAAIALAPLPTLAQTFCEIERPDWDGTPATALSEAIYLFLTPQSVFLFVASALALRLRNKWVALAAVVGWTIWVSVIAFPRGKSVELAMIEGCIGQPSIFIGIVGALCLGLIFLTAPPRDQDG